MVAPPLGLRGAVVFYNGTSVDGDDRAMHTLKERLLLQGMDFILVGGWVERERQEPILQLFLRPLAEHHYDPYTADTTRGTHNSTRH